MRTDETARAFVGATHIKHISIHFKTHELTLFHHHPCLESYASFGQRTLKTQNNLTAHGTFCLIYYFFYYFSNTSRSVLVHFGFSHTLFHCFRSFVSSVPAALVCACSTLVPLTLRYLWWRSINIGVDVLCEGYSQRSDISRSSACRVLFGSFEIRTRRMRHKFEKKKNKSRLIRLNIHAVTRQHSLYVKCTLYWF